MLIVGVDYHPSFQQVAYLNQDTGECVELRLNHGDGEAERFYRDLQRTRLRLAHQPFVAPRRYAWPIHLLFIDDKGRTDDTSAALDRLNEDKEKVAIGAYWLFARSFF